VIERHNDNTLFSIYRKQISCSPFDPQTKVEDKPSVIWSERINLCLQRPISPAIFLAKQIWPDPGNRPARVVYQKQHNSMLHSVLARPPARYLRALSETGSTLL
jgi:hypothetical protein